VALGHNQPYMQLKNVYNNGHCGMKFTFYRRSKEKK